MLSNTNYFHKHFFTIVLLVFYFFEAINKYFIVYHNHFLIVLKLIKAVVGLYAITLLLINKGNKRITLSMMVMIIIFFLGQKDLSPNYNNDVVVCFFRYLFFIILVAYTNAIEENKKATELLFKIYEKIILFNSALIIIGLIIGLKLFKTYTGQRFGYNGLLVSSATSTYFYCVVMFYYIIKYKTTLFHSATRLFVIVSILFVGTKSLYMLLVLISVCYMFFFASRKLKVILIISSSILLAFFYYYFLHTKISTELSIIDTITSSRSLIFVEDMLPFIEKNWNRINYLFGGINNIITRPQMAVFDLFYFFGLIGASFYLFTFFKFYFNFKLTKIQLVLYCILSLVVFISGNFFINTSIVIYMLIIKKFFINFSENSSFKKFKT